MQAPGCSSAGFATEFAGQSRQFLCQALSAAGVGPRQRPQALSEDAPGAVGIVAEELAHPEFQVQAARAERQISQVPGVVTVYPLAGALTQWATGCLIDRGQSASQVFIICASVKQAHVGIQSEQL